MKRGNKGHNKISFDDLRDDKFAKNVNVAWEEEGSQFSFLSVAVSTLEDCSCLELLGLPLICAVEAQEKGSDVLSQVWKPQGSLTDKWED